MIVNDNIPKELPLPSQVFEDLFETIPAKAQRLMLEAIIDYYSGDLSVGACRNRLYRLFDELGEVGAEIQSKGDLVFNHYV